MKTATVSVYRLENVLHISSRQNSPPETAYPFRVRTGLREQTRKRVKHRK